MRLEASRQGRSPQGDCRTRTSQFLLAGVCSPLASQCQPRVPGPGVQTGERMKGQRVRGAERFPLVAATGFRGAWVCVPDGRTPYVHLQFCRFAGCPITSSHCRHLLIAMKKSNGRGLGKSSFFVLRTKT
jgi:hypothetical protein